MCFFFRLIFPVFFVDLLTYLNTVHGVVIPPAGLSDCVKNVFSFAAPLCSNLFVISMTFDRFYGIIKPHKAASFNTVKRARIMVACIVIFCGVYNIPHYFLSAVEGTHCTPYSNAMQYVYGQLYFWLSFVIGFCFPFLSLLIMNCFIINTLRNRSSLLEKANIGSKGQTQGQPQGQGQISSVKTSEIQIYIILLLVTFSFLVLTTPGQVILLYIMTVDYNASPEAFAKYYLLENIGEKMYYTNCGINFFLYVLSGRRFRTDLITLFKCRRGIKDDVVSADPKTKVTSLETDDET